MFSRPLTTQSTIAARNGLACREWGNQVPIKAHNRAALVQAHLGWQRVGKGRLIMSGGNMKLEQLCRERGVEFVDRGNGHIQLKGPLLVNYYPESKSKSAYVAGTKRAAKHVSPEKAVDMCFMAPVAQGVKDKRKGNSRRKRVGMLKKGARCYWCDCLLNLDTSTIEHIVPLDRGGLDNANNRTLACTACNGARGNDMPELKGQ